MQLLRHLTDAHAPEWFADDGNFAAAMRIPMILKQQMALTLPQMPALLGIRDPAIKRADVGCPAVAVAPVRSTVVLMMADGDG